MTYLRDKCEYKYDKYGNDNCCFDYIIKDVLHPHEERMKERQTSHHKKTKELIKKHLLSKSFTLKKYYVRNTYFLQDLIGSLERYKTRNEFRDINFSYSVILDDDNRQKYLDKLILDANKFHEYCGCIQNCFVVCASSEYRDSIFVVINKV